MQAMQAANRLQRALRTERGLSFGAWQMLPGANHARFMARTGYDWICVDTEHGNIAGMYGVAGYDYSDGYGLTAADWQMHEAVAAIAATGVSPIVRIAANEGWMVKRESSIDSGGRGYGDKLTVDRGLGCGCSWNRRASFVYC